MIGLNGGAARIAAGAACAIALTACETTDMEALQSVLGAVGEMQNAGALSQADATAGLREALIVASGAAVSEVGRTDGYFADPEIKIPLPGFLGQAQSTLQPFGMAGLFDDLEVRLNRGAEQAAPEARAIFGEAVRAMTVADAIAIVQGPDDAATTYFRDAMSPRLRATFRPVVEEALLEAGALQALGQIDAQLAAVPLAGSLSNSATSDLIDYGVQSALDGLFYYVAEEEKAIRSDPAKRTTELLRRVFGS